MIPTENPSLKELPNGHARRRLLALLDRPNDATEPPTGSDELRRFASDQCDKEHGPVSRKRMLSEYPTLVAAVIWQSASYHRPHTAADVLTAFLRDEDTASELHFHIASVGKIGLKEANDEIVIDAAENMLHLQQSQPGLPGWTRANEAVAQATLR